MARAIWKGAISFGLVHIPVALISATTSENIDFDWLDERSMDPVGYKRINKTTGKEVTKEHIVKGVQYEKGRYVIISDEEIRAAHPKSTQTIDIFAFLDRTEIPLPHIDTPYYLTPDKRGEKVYALLRDTLASTGRVALAKVILHTKQHLAAVMTLDAALVLILLRWPAEVRDLNSLELSGATTNAELSASEKEMAKRLVEDMRGSWQPEQYHDTFQEKIMQLVEKKALDGNIENVEAELPEERKSADIIDLTELLRQSLAGKARPRVETNAPSSGAVKAENPETKSAKKTAAKKTPTKPDAAAKESSSTKAGTKSGSKKSVSTAVKKASSK